MSPKLAKIPFVGSLVLMLLPVYRANAKAAGVPYVAPAVHTGCYYYSNYKVSGSQVVCYGSGGTACVVCSY
jgi:hypothetical protein